jgi:hypothetical protein
MAAVSGPRRVTALLTGLAAAGAVAALVLPASPASAVEVHGIYLASNPRLALAAPNTVVSGSQAQLKSCLANTSGPPQFCANDANIKLSQQFTVRENRNDGALVILNENGMCLTNRSKGGPVTFEPCGNAGAGYASQRWLGEGDSDGTMTGTIQNVKTQGYLSPATQPADHTPVITSDGRWIWGISQVTSPSKSAGQ